jgi:hypothetical protein
MHCKTNGWLHGGGPHASFVTPAPGVGVAVPKTLFTTAGTPRTGADDARGVEQQLLRHLQRAQLLHLRPRGFGRHVARVAQCSAGSKARRVHALLHRHATIAGHTTAPPVRLCGREKGGGALPDHTSPAQQQLPLNNDKGAGAVSRKHEAHASVQQSARNTHQPETRCGATHLKQEVMDSRKGSCTLRKGNKRSSQSACERDTKR